MSRRVRGDPRNISGPVAAVRGSPGPPQLEKSGFEPKINNNISNSLSQDHEKNLVKTLSKLNLIIEESIRNTSPMRLSKFAFTLSSNFNSFYEKSNVLHEQNDNIKNARLALVYSFRNTIKLILEMIGINTLEKI